MQPPWSIATSTITLPFFHDAPGPPRYQARGRPRDEDRPTTRSASEAARGRYSIAIDGMHIGGHHVGQISEAFEITSMMTTLAPSPAATWAASSPTTPAAEDHHAAGDARHSAEQYPPPHHRLFEIFCPLLDAHLPRDFAHRRQTRQPPGLVPNRLILHRHDPAFQTRLGQLATGREVKRAKHQLPWPKLTDLLGLRLLHFDNHLRRREHLLGRRDDLRPGFAIILIRKPASHSRLALHHHLMPRPRQTSRPHRHQPDAILIRLDFFWYSNSHGLESPSLHMFGTISTETSRPYGDFLPVGSKVTAISSITCRTASAFRRAELSVSSDLAAFFHASTIRWY